MNGKMIRDYILNVSFENHLRNLPVAFSHCDYLYQFYEALAKNYTDASLIFGEDEGAQAHYLAIDDHLGLKFKASTQIEDTLHLSTLHKLIINENVASLFKYIDNNHSGCALGIAEGLALANPYKNVIVNFSDYSMLKEDMLSALAFLLDQGTRISNLIVMINACTYKGVRSLERVINSFYKSTSLKTYFIDGHKWDIRPYNEFLTDVAKAAKVVVFNTTLGYGITEFIENPEYFKYLELQTSEQLKAYQASLSVRN